MNKLLLVSFALIFFLKNGFAQTDLEFRNFNSTNQPIFGGNNFKSAAVTSTGKIWVGSQYHGLLKYDPVTDAWTKSPDILDVSINDIKPANNGGIWVGQSGRQLSQGGSSNVAGGVNYYPGPDFSGMQFYSVTSGGNLTSRNVRSVWVDELHTGPDGKKRVWAAQSVSITTNTSSAGGISTGLNTAANFFNKIFNGLQVTPYVSAPNAGLPQCLSVAGSQDEVWVFAAVNFGKSQILRYRADDFGVFIGAYDNTNTPVFANGFRANAMYFDNQGKGWVGLSDGGLRIKVGSSWKIMNQASIFPSGTIVNPNAICSDENGFVYFGTSNGLVVYKGGAVDSAGSYRVITTADGLPTNAISGVAADTVNHRLILAHNAGISFMKYKKKIDIKLEWDHGFPQLSIRPIGVAADGTSRLYLKVRRNDSTSLLIKKVAVSMQNMITQSASLLGKLKVATVTDAYSNEANTGTAQDVSRTDSTAKGDFYFWYVAPDDFSKDSLSADATKMERLDSVKVKVTYNDNSVDSSYMPIRIQHPPVMIASLASKAEEIISSMEKIIEKMNDNSTQITLNPRQSIFENASRLINGDQSQNADFANTIQGLIGKMRLKGFASTKVDFVGHGVGGIVMRATEALKKEKFYADGNYTYNNYGKGFLNKFVSINTPHDGSPVFEAVKELIPKMSEISAKIMKNIALVSPEQLDPYEILSLPSGSSPSIDLLKNLLNMAVLDSGGLKLPASPFKNHLIGSDLDASENNPAVLSAMGNNFARIGELCAMVARDVALPPFKDSLTQNMGSSVSLLGRVLRFYGKYAELKGVPDFVTNSDLIGTVSSQLAGAAVSAANVTVLKSPVKSDITHKAIAANSSVMKKVINLLNTAIADPSFGNSIPATAFFTPVAQIANKIITTTYDTAKIVIVNRGEISNFSNLPTGGEPDNVVNDTTITLNIRVKDTVRLQYLYVNFQDTLYSTRSRARDQQVTLRVKKSSLYSGSQELTAVGVYESGDTVRYHADTLRRFVNLPDTLRGFRVTTDEFSLADGLPFYPSFEVKINDEWTPLSSADTDITNSIEVANKVAYDAQRLAFDAIGDGYTRVYFQYKTYRDTVTLNTLLPQELIAINRSISSGNFKDATTWSKGRAPLPGDSVIISSGHNITLDSSLQIRALRIDNGGTLTMNNSTRMLRLGETGDGTFMLDNYGTFNISNGTLSVNGRVKLNAAATFNMTGGSLIIDGNTGNMASSPENGLFLFEAAPGMAAFNFTNGTLQLIDPPFAVASQALKCPYNFGVNSTLSLGNGISLTASNNPDGFGGNGFPPQIGKLILNAGTQTGNRKLKITKPLSVKGSLLIKTGSNMDIQAPVTAAP